MTTEGQSQILPLRNPGDWEDVWCFKIPLKFVLGHVSVAHAWTSGGNRVMDGSCVDSSHAGGCHPPRVCVRNHHAAFPILSHVS